MFVGRICYLVTTRLLGNTFIRNTRVVYMAVLLTDLGGKLFIYWVMQKYLVKSINFLWATYILTYIHLA